MNSKLILSALILSSLLFLGCGTGNQIGPEVDDSKTGVKELALSSDTFPQAVFANSQIQGTFTLKNNAGYDAENVQIKLLGLDRNYVELSYETESINILPGRSLFSKEGGEEIIAFRGTVKNLAKGADQNTQRYLVLVTYSSKVEFSPTVCVDSGLYLVGSGCNFKEIGSGGKKRPTPETFSGQGAPVAFNNLEIIPYTGTESEIELRMKVADRGRGQIKLLRLGRSALGSIPLQCEFHGKNVERPEGVIFNEKASSQEVDIVCSGKLESGVAYKTALFIELFYDYEFTESRTLEIRR